MAQEFVGKSLALSSDGLAKAAQSLSVQAPEVWCVLSVETSGCGFLADRRPQILFERHIFHRLTGGRYDDGDISDPTPGGYGVPNKPLQGQHMLRTAGERGQRECGIDPGVTRERCRRG